MWGVISLSPMLAKYSSFPKEDLGIEILIPTQVADTVNS